MISIQLLKRPLIAIASLLAVSAAFALGAYPDLPSVQTLPGAAASWATSTFSGDHSGMWEVVAALAVMAVIAKRNGKA
ncbi:hypothetical protein [Pseudorhodoferax soli]|jgi:hypothetical protein|uniref:hypothetical protein n=1 Tax=Pseudorhodoferax soli TaxID=545864 RepID=UPI0011C0797B|nr:hypothetical protein [Pseudorhodoferax soli]